MTPRLFLFDLDGTLADTDADIRGAWKAAIGDLGLDCPLFDVKFVAGPPIDEMARTLFPDSFTPELADAIRTAFAKHYDSDGFPQTREYPGVIDAVRELKRRGARVCIATNKRFAGAMAMARRFGWIGLFDGIYAGDMHKDGPAGKLRKPQLVDMILRELGEDPSGCVLVGDTVNDFEAAKANGVFPVAVAWGYGTDAERALAGKTIGDPAELLALRI